MSALVVLTPPDAHPGFALAGVLHEAVETAQCEARLRHWLGDPQIGVVVVDERLLGTLSDERLRKLEQGAKALLVVMPAPAGGVVGEDYLRRLLRRVLGYQVRIRR